MTSNLHHEPLPEIESDIGECGQILQQDGTFIYPEPTEQPVIDLAQLQRIQAEILDNVSRLSSELERISETQEEQARIAKGGG